MLTAYMSTLPCGRLDNDTYLVYATIEDAIYNFTHPIWGNIDLGKLASYVESLVEVKIDYNGDADSLSRKLYNHILAEHLVRITDGKQSTPWFEDYSSAEKCAVDMGIDLDDCDLDKALFKSEVIVKKK